MPGGVSSPVRAFLAVKGTPRFIDRGEKAFLVDVEGNKYIDYVMSFGPLILGHAHEEVILKLKRTLEKGTSFGAPSALEVELAEKIVNHHPAAEWVRFVNSGTEATMSAIRLARAATGRDLIIKFDGCYHGHVDSLLVKAGSGLATFAIASSSGVLPETAAKTIVLPLGDVNALKNAFEQHGDNIAAVIIEGVPANMGLLPQSPEFMKAIENECKKHGALFILDEVITGFRLGFGGATAKYNLRPDIVTFGKIIGGGLPVGAYGGRKDLMDLVAPLGKVYQAGTLSGNPLAMQAGIATLEVLENNPSVYDALRKNTTHLKEEMLKLSRENNLTLQAVSVESMMWMIFQSTLPTTTTEIDANSMSRYADFHGAALESGIYAPPSGYEVWFLSMVHDEAIVENTIERLGTVFAKISAE